VKVAIVSHVLPPTWSGQSMILGRLLHGFDPDEYVLIRTMNLPIEADSFAEPLPGRCYHLPDAWARMPWTTWRLHVANVRNMAHTLRVRAHGIADVLRRECCDAVVACTGGDMLDVPAAWLAARKTGVSFYPYFFDHWSQQSLGETWRRRLAQRAESRVLARAAVVIVPNEFLAQELAQRYSVQTAIVRNGCEIPPANPRSDDLPRDPAEIVYTGAVYEANHDTFRNLVDALDLTAREASVHVYTAQTAEQLGDAGIAGPVDIHEHLPVREMPLVQQAADILFLPLAFNSPYPTIIRTSNPGKMGEYLAANRPILVHAPPDSFVAWYFRRHRCGEVVDTLDPRLLADALDRLLEDRAHRAKLASRARERAVADFDIRLARRAFAEVIGLTAPMDESSAQSVSAS
jgi:glycosyltransferase involved in cell wall biosynthesis